MILDAAIRVFAREGFHRCRVSDIANEADVAYGLVYHYFRSKDEVLDTLFTERWTLLLEAIAEVDATRRCRSARSSRGRVFIIDSYQQRPRPDEGDHRRGHARREHLRARAPRRRSAQAYEGIAEIFRKAQDDGAFRTDFSPEFATLCFYGAIEQLLTRLDLRGDPGDAGRLRAGQADGRRDRLRRPRSARRRQRLARRRRHRRSGTTSLGPSPRTTLKLSFALAAAARPCAAFA